MLLVYRPEGANERKWTYAPDKLISSEAVAIEKATGLTYAEFGVELVKGSATARRALLWVYLKREDAPLRLEQVDPPVGAIGVEYEPHEIAAMLVEVEKDADLSEAERDAIRKDLQAQLTEDAEPDPKAPASDAGTST